MKKVYVVIQHNIKLGLVNVIGVHGSREGAEREMRVTASNMVGYGIEFAVRTAGEDEVDIYIYIIPDDAEGIEEAIIPENVYFQIMIEEQPLLP